MRKSVGNICKSSKATSCPAHWADNGAFALAAQRAAAGVCPNAPCDQREVILAAACAL